MADDAAVLGGGGVCGSADNVECVTAAGVAGVDGVLAVNGDRVESTVGSEGDAVVGQDIGGEVVARSVPAIGDKVLFVEGGLSLTGSSAKARIKGVGIEETHAVVGANIGSVDSSRKALYAVARECGGLCA